MFKKYCLVIILFVGFKSLIAQEFNLDVQVTAPQTRLVDPKVFKTLETTLNEFLNNYKWSEDEYEPEERIEGSFSLIVLEENSQTSFRGEIRIQIIRPVYNSNYKTQILNIVDPLVSFGYTEYQPLENSVNSYVDNLSSIISYYAYMMLAYDYDSFAPMGGQDYFKKAQNVISVLPTNISLGDDGWKIIGTNNNRYWLLENALSPRMKDFRYGLYEYHRTSLDAMYDDPEKSKAIMVSVLNTLKTANKSYPQSTFIQTFTDTKRGEIVDIFKDASRGQQEKVFDIMSEVNPSQISLYNEIKKR